MKKQLIFFALFTLLFSNIYGQDKVIKHTVKKGETITQIALQYKTTPLNIFKLNPDIATGLKPDMLLLVPNNKNLIAEKPTVKKDNVQKTVFKSKIISHTVLSKETLYSLATKYNTTVEAIENLNPAIKTDGLKISAVIQIIYKWEEAVLGKHQRLGPLEIEKTSTTTTNKASQVSQTHIVEAKETKYSIAKKYNISIEQLEKQNPQIAGGLDVGMDLLISGTRNSITSSVEKAVAKPLSKPATVKKLATSKNIQVLETPLPTMSFKEYSIKPKETIYSLANKFGLSQAELLTINPSLSAGVNVGQIIKYPANVLLKENETKVFTNLSKSATSRDRKKLVLLLPFNISKIENDTVISTVSKLKSDKFLNMTLDFYAGALQAIDSAKTLGLNLDIKILDSEETKASSNIQSLIDNDNLQKADVILGPFYQSNVERTASLLSDSKTIIISPLSKEPHKSSSNLIVSNISTELVKNAMFNFMKAKSGNILAIIDNKKLATKEFLGQRSDVKVIPMNVKNTFDTVSLAQYFNTNQINYVILDSENTSLILKTTSALINLQKNFQVQLVILEKNETLDFEEIPLSRLTRLKMLYPSTAKDNKSVEAAIFDKDFKLKNKIFPNNYAVRGFDLTFDIILRLTQEKSFLETIEESTSEQVESKFEYEKNIDGGFYNNGVYILEYQSDLTIKEAK